MPTTPVSSKTNSTIGVSAFGGQNANKVCILIYLLFVQRNPLFMLVQDDLVSFLKLFRPDMPSDTTFATQLFDDGNNNQTLSDAGTEAVSLMPSLLHYPRSQSPQNLDIQYTIGLANGIPESFIDIGDDTHDGDDGGFLDIINDLLAETNPPLVFTTSYGAVGDESGLSIPLTL